MSGGVYSFIAMTTPSSTVSGLPAAASSTGVQYLVTDALLPAALANVTGGGSVKVLVISTGAAWIVA